VVFDTYKEEAALALKAVREAAKLSRQIQDELVSPAITKADQTPVTIADYASQALVGRLMLEQFPGDRLVAEEDSQTLKDESDGEALSKISRYLQRLYSDTDQDKVCIWIDHGTQDPGERFWTLDPIDGTKGFLRGDQYVSALALIEDGVVMVAALGCPKLNRQMQPESRGEGSAVLAVRGEGCFGFGMEDDDPVRLVVSAEDQPGQARLLRSVESRHTNEGIIAELIEKLGVKTPPVLMDSQAKYAVMAAGSGDLLFRLISPSLPDYQEKIWDQAAGTLIVEEAGGAVSDLRGDRLDFGQGRTLRQNIGVIASNGKLHEVALAALREVGGDRRPHGSTE
jgi:3'(2'), 5'-bisphosphate nucleotidase